MKKHILKHAGFYNNVFDVDDKFIIKICGREKEEKFDVEARFYNENSSSKYIPKLYKYDKSKETIDSVYEIIEKIEGKSLYYYWYKMNEQEREDTIKQVIDIVKQVHKVVPEKPPCNWGKKIKQKVVDLYNKNKQCFAKSSRK